MCLFVGMTETSKPPEALVWLSCLECNRPMIPISMIKTDDGSQWKTAIKIWGMTILQVSVICPYCGKVRKFRSQKAKNQNVEAIE